GRGRLRGTHRVVAARGWPLAHRLPHRSLETGGDNGTRSTAYPRSVHARVGGEEGAATGCHCEERSDAAISIAVEKRDGDFFAPPAMTGLSDDPRRPLPCPGQKV